MSLITPSTSTITDALFIESKNVKVFPCAYRGYFTGEQGTAQVFDPEARGFTEYNYSNIFSKPSTNKNSFVISWTPSANGTSILKCVIGGYYFELKGLSESDFWDSTNKECRCLAIRLDPINISTTTHDGSRNSNIIGSLIDENQQYLDVMSAAGSNIYIFAGLAVVRNSIADSSASISYHLAPFKNTDNEGTLVIDFNNLRLNDLIDTDDGRYALRLLGDAKTGTGTYASRAQGDYATAFGKETSASAEATATFGTKTVASNINAFATGLNNKATAENSAAFGENNETTLDSQFIIGKNSVKDTAQKYSFIIGRGGSSSNPKNIFTVETNGNIESTGNLKTVGTITSSGTSNNTLTLGGAASSAGYGAIKVYGDNSSGNAPVVFDVDKTGAVILKNNLEVGTTAEIKGDTTIRGKLDVTGRIKTTGVLEVKGTITANGTSNNTLTLGSTTSGEYGAINVYGNGASTVFTVNNNGNVDARGTLQVSGTTTLNNDVSIASGADLEVTGDTTLRSTLGVTGATRLLSTLYVDGATSINGATDITGITKITVPKVTIEKAAWDSTRTYAVGEYVTHNGNIYECITACPKNKTWDEVAANWRLFGAITLFSSDEGTISPLFTVNHFGEVFLRNDLSLYNGEARKFNVNSTGEITADGKIRSTTGVLELGGSTYGTLSWNSSKNIFNSSKGIRINGVSWLWGTQYLMKSDTPDADAYKTSVATITLNNESGNIKTIGTLTVDGATRLKSTVDVTGALTARAGLTLVNGTGTVPVFSVDTSGNVSASGTITAGGDISTTGKLTVTGEVKASSYDTHSDIRLKQNIKDYTASKSILDLQVKEFEYIADEKHIKHIGCIAQDLQQICPEIVHEGADGYLTIEESKLVYLLLEEVKSLRKELNALKGE